MEMELRIRVMMLRTETTFAELAELFGIKRGTMWSRLHARRCDKETRSTIIKYLKSKPDLSNDNSARPRGRLYNGVRSVKEVVYWGHRKFHRYVNAKEKRSRMYFQAVDGKSPIYLHIAKWEYKNKRKVPPGHHVHHIDHNHLNNEYGNLTLVSRSEHNSIHKTKHGKRKRIKNQVLNLPKETRTRLL